MALIMKNLPTLVAACLLMFGVTGLTGCASRAPESLSSQLEIPTSFTQNGTRKVPDRWWTVFGDQSLNALIHQALQSNFNLKTAWQRLQEAQAIVDRELAALYPDLQGVSEGEVGGSDTKTREMLQLGLTSSYEMDLWGRIHSSIEAQRYRAQATRSDYHTAAISLSAEVARTWYRLAETRAQLQLIDGQIDANQTALHLLKSRFGTGQIRAVDVLRQRQLLESTREQRAVAESRMQVLEHQLAVLLGRAPQKGRDYTNGSLPEIPPLPDPGLPVGLIRRRPDVISAYQQLQAADMDWAAAISSQYPRLTLKASLNTSEDKVTDLFQNWAHSFAGNLVAPLLDAGQRKAEVGRTKALRRQRLYEYGQAVLSAFQEVEDALIQEKKQRERIRSLEEQVRLAGEAYNRLRIEYFNGVSDFIDVLTALTEKQQLQQDLLSTRLFRLEYRIALYRALAGGFHTKREKKNNTPEQPS